MKLTKFKDEDALAILMSELPNQKWPDLSADLQIGDVVLEAEWHDHPITVAVCDEGGLVVRGTETGNTLCTVDVLDFEDYLKETSLRNAIDMVNNHLIHLGQAYKELDALCMQEIQPLLDKNKYEQAMLTLHDMRISKSKVGREIYKRIVDDAYENGEVDQIIETNASQLIED